MPKIKKKQLNIIFILVLITLIGSYIYFVFLPQEKEIAGLKAEEKNKEVQLSKAAILSKNQQRLTEEIKDLEYRVEQVKRELPKEKEIPELLQRIDSTGLASDMDFLYFKPRPVAAREFYGEVPIDISIKGGFHDLGRFLNMLATLPRLMNVSNVKITGISESSENITIKAELVAMTYIYMEGK